MTTGEKIINGRKSMNLTQEQLADLLEVSRQSVSKWESNAAFPETNKLKDLAKMFNVTVDYLLNDDSEETIMVVKEEKEKAKTVSFFKSRSARVLYYSLFELIVFLLLFLIPIAKLEFVESIFNNHVRYYVSINTYQIIGSSGYEIGNYFALLGFLSVFGSVICGVIYSLNKNKIANKIKYIFMALVPVCYIITMLIIFPSISAGVIVFIILSILNLVGYIFFHKKLVRSV